MLVDGTISRHATEQERKRAADGHYLREQIEKHGIQQVLPCILGFWADETSSTLSKRSAHFETWQFHSANLPAKLNQHPMFVKFIAAAKNVSCLDIANAVVADVNNHLENGVVCAAPDGHRVLLVGTAAYLMGDGPKHLIFCNHAGVQATFFCRMCEHDRANDPNVGFVPTTEPDTLSGLDGASEMDLDVDDEPPPKLRNVRHTLETIAVLRTMQSTMTAAELSLYGRGIKPHANALLDLKYLDVHLHSVTDGLHWGPLGGIKLAHSMLLDKVQADSQEGQETSAFLDAIDPSSFKHHVSGNTAVRHRGSMVGADFKYVGQVGPYLARQMAPRRGWHLVQAYAAHSTIQKYIYQAIIPDPAAYARDIGAAAKQVLKLYNSNNFLIAAGRKRFKIHQHAHIRVHVGTFVHFIPYQCEAAEATNGDVREHIVFSNRAAPSRDVAVAFACLMGLAFVLAGGCWLDSKGVSRKAGSELIDLFGSKEARQFMYFAPKQADEDSGRYDPGKAYLELQPSGKQGSSMKGFAITDFQIEQGVSLTIIQKHLERFCTLPVD